MIDFRTKEEIEAISELFDAPKLFYKDRKDAGPDEELYLLEDSDGKKYGIWSRDYMTELEYEQNALKDICSIDVKKWVRTKTGEDMVDDGDWFAMFEL